LGWATDPSIPYYHTRIQTRSTRSTHANNQSTQEKFYTGMCLEDDHVMKNTLKIALRKKRFLREIPWFGLFLFSQKKKKGDIISPFLRISSMC
jgi:hypothetical protein